MCFTLTKQAITIIIMYQGQIQHITFPDWMRAIQESGLDAGDLLTSQQPRQDIQFGSDSGTLDRKIDETFLVLETLLEKFGEVIDKQPADTEEKVAEVDTPDEKSTDKEYMMLAFKLYEIGNYEACVEFINMILEGVGKDSEKNYEPWQYKVIELKAAILTDSYPLSPFEKTKKIDEALSSYDLIPSNELSSRAMSIRLFLSSLKYRYLPDITSKITCLEKVLQDCEDVLSGKKKIKEKITEGSAFYDIMLTQAWILTDLVDLEVKDAMHKVYIGRVFNVMLKLLTSNPSNVYYWNLTSYVIFYLTHICTDSYRVRVLEKSAYLFERVITTCGNVPHGMYANVASIYLTLARVSSDPHVSAYALCRVRELIDKRSDVLRDNLVRRDISQASYNYNLSHLYVQTARMEYIESNNSVTLERKISHLHSAVSLCESALKLNPYNANARARHTQATVMLLDLYCSGHAMEDMIKKAIQDCQSALSYAVDPAHLFDAMSMAYEKLAEIVEVTSENEMTKLSEKYAKLAQNHNIKYKR